MTELEQVQYTAVRLHLMILALCHGEVVPGGVVTEWSEDTLAGLGISTEIHNDALRCHNWIHSDAFRGHE